VEYEEIINQKKFYTKVKVGYSNEERSLIKEDQPIIGGVS
jgi:hypothetical protein